MDKARKSANWKTAKVILNASDMVLMCKCSRYAEMDPFRDGGICLSKVDVSIPLTGVQLGRKQTLESVSTAYNGANCL